jgi:predicted RNA-binding protein with RPS1 domain
LKDNLAGNAAESAHPMSFLLSEEFDLSLPQTGDIREGEVVAHRNHEILIDIGAKSEGIIPSEEVERMDSEIKTLLAIGNTIPVYIVNPDDSDGNIILSYAKAMEEEDWETAQTLHDSQDIFKGKIIGFNSMIIVVPPARPAAVPDSKSSLATVPIKGSCICVCGSIPPGMTYCPPASIVVAPRGASSSAPIALIVPFSHSTSARHVCSAVTMVPPLIRTAMSGPLVHGHQVVDYTAQR